MAFPYLIRPGTSSSVLPIGDFTVAGKAADRGINKVDPRLVDIMRKAAAGSPYDVELFSGKRFGSSRGSRHNTGNAVDIVLIDKATGTAVPNLKSSVGFPIYRDFALAARDVQMADYPELENAFRWGGGFSGAEEKYGAVDLMHFDIKPNGKMAGLVGGDQSAKAAWDAGLKLTTPQEKILAGMGAGWIYSSEGEFRAPGNVQFADFSGRNRNLGSPADANNPKGLTPPADIPAIQLSAADRDAAIRTVIGEAVGEGDEGQAAVAHVIRNRYTEGGGKSVAAIATDPSQFDAWNHDLVTAYAPGDPEYDRAAGIVDGVFSGKAPDPTGGATFFRTKSSKPASFWSKGVTEVKTIGNHVFGVAKDAVRNVAAAVTPKPAAVPPSKDFTKADQVNRPDVLAGKLQVEPGTPATDDRSPLEEYLAGGPGFDYQSGGKSKTFGSMPYGKYPIGDLTTAEERKAAGNSYQEDAFPLPNMVDPKMATFTDPDLKRTERAQGGRRTGMLIHSGDDIDKVLNAGCLSIPKEQWPAFKRTVLAQQKEYGDLVIEIGPDGAAIRPKSEVKPDDTKVIPAKAFIARTKEKAAPVVSMADSAYLRRDDSAKPNPQTALLQATLKEKGFYSGKIDGRYGPQTEKAVGEAQRSANGALKVDRVAGPATLEYLGLPTSKAALAQAAATVPMAANPELPANRARLNPAERTPEEIIADIDAATPPPEPRLRPDRTANVPTPRERPSGTLVATREEHPGALPAAGEPAAPAGVRSELSRNAEAAMDTRAPGVGDDNWPFDPGGGRPDPTAAAARRTPPASAAPSSPSLQDYINVYADPRRAGERGRSGPLNARLADAKARLADVEKTIADHVGSRTFRPLSPDPRDAIRLSLEPGAGRASGLVANPARPPNVRASNDVATRERPSWLDSALTSILPAENGIFDFVYDPRPSRNEAADVGGPPARQEASPPMAAPASGTRSMDTLSSAAAAAPTIDTVNPIRFDPVGSRVDGKTTRYAPYLDNGEKIPSAPANAGATSFRPMGAVDVPHDDSTRLAFAEEAPSSDAALTLRSFVSAPPTTISAAPVEGPGSLADYAEKGIMGGFYTKSEPVERHIPAPQDDTSLDAVAVGSDEPRQPVSLAAVSSTVPARQPPALQTMREMAGQRIEDAGRDYLRSGGPLRSALSAYSALGGASTSSLFTPSRQITTPISGQTYTLGTVGNRSAIQGNGWTAVQESDGTYSMSYDDDD